MPVDELGLERLVALLARELRERLEVGELLLEPVDELDVVAVRAPARS